MTVLSRLDAALISLLPCVGGEIAVDSGLLPAQTGWRRLRDRGGLASAGANPVARANVCPALDPPGEPGFHAFCYTVPDDSAASGFVIAGSGEVPEGRTGYLDHIVARGDTSPTGLRAKAAWVMGEMQRR